MNENVMRWTGGLSVLAALWLAFSPAWFSYTSSSNMWAQIILGIVVGVLAIVRMSTPRAIWPSGLNFLIGIWFIVAPWVLASTTAVKWNQVLLGIILVGLTATDLSLGTTPAEIASDSGGLSSREASMGFGERMPDRRSRNESGGGRR